MGTDSRIAAAAALRAAGPAPALPRLAGSVPPISGRLSQWEHPTEKAGPIGRCFGLIDGGGYQWRFGCVGPTGGLNQSGASDGGRRGRNFYDPEHGGTFVPRRGGPKRRFCLREGGKTGQILPRQPGEPLNKLDSPASDCFLASVPFAKTPSCRCESVLFSPLCTVQMSPQRFAMLLFCIASNPSGQAGGPGSRGRALAAQNASLPRVSAPVPGGVRGSRNASRPAERKAEWAAAVANVGDTCRGYYDVMGQYDPPFNCSSGTYLYCCGTCHYRFCCEFRSYKLSQGSCNNYDSPDWANTPLTSSAVTDQEAYDPAKDRTNSTVYIICGVLTITLAVGITIKVAFRKVAQQPGDLNVSRALVDILRHQAVSVPNTERNNQTSVGNTALQNDTAPHISKTQYTPVKMNKATAGNGQHNLRQQLVNSPTHAGTLPLDRSRRNNVNLYNPCSRQNALLTSCSYHNLSHLPPSYESTMKPEMNKYSSLKRLAAKDLDDYCKKRHLAEVTARGTLPLRAMKADRADAAFRDAGANPRRVMSQDRLLGEALPPLPPPPPPPRPSHLAYATIARERLLSPDRLGRRGGGAAPPHHPVPFGERPLSKKALSQSNVCAATPWLDRHQIVKMNSHPPSAAAAASSPRSAWGEAPIADRRQAFAAKRHSTVEQLHFIPGHANQVPQPQAPPPQLRTGSKTEVTV
ncbi:protein shisa-6-like [Heterodontus francisci]|uniref:protein shisa-6-like n=1 Tax=Heterodontus francisci TaxID=7792 RepID=UPI00355BF46E